MRVLRAGVGCARDLGQRHDELVEAGAGPGARRDDRSSRHELVPLLERKSERLLVDGVGLRDRDDTVADAEQSQDREVLVGLRTRTLGGVDDEQEQVDAGRAGHHVANEALVAGDVHDRQPAAVRQLQRRVAEIDRDAALLLLG